MCRDISEFFAVGFIEVYIIIGSYFLVSALFDMRIYEKILTLGILVSKKGYKTLTTSSLQLSL